MDLKLNINEFNIRPGAIIDTKLLKESHFQQAGLLKRLIKPLPRGHAFFVAENCTISCFDDRLSLYPCTHAYLNKDRQWKTQGSVLLVDGKVQKMDFHVLEGIYAAPNFIETVNAICSEDFGQPKKINNNHFLWKTEELSFSCYLLSDNINACFSIEFQGFSSEDQTVHPLAKAETKTEAQAEAKIGQTPPKLTPAPLAPI